MMNSPGEYKGKIALVCIDSYENGVPGGRFYDTNASQWDSFYSLSEFLMKMEHSMDRGALPQSYTRMRTVVPEKRAWPARPTMTEVSFGRLATLTVQILFRQNASWQGNFTWMERREEQQFRSVLELISMMDGVLRATA